MRLPAFSDEIGSVVALSAAIRHGVPFARRSAGFGLLKKERTLR
jgi:hypothetical protein